MFTTHLTKLTFSTALVLGSLAFVGGNFSPISAAQAEKAAQLAPATNPVVPVQGLYDALAKIVKSSEGVSQRKNIVEPAVDNAFNLDEIMHRSIGLHYNNLNKDERASLLQAFRNFTVARYVSTFKPGSDTVFTIVPTVKTTQTGQTLVHTTIGGKADSSNATSIDYVMKQTDKGWQITDVLLDGHISQVAAQRSDFKAAFAQGGAKALTHVLNQKANDFLSE
ncbi:hypothetical protein GT348_01370 [Aristophania vespae]|uniref:Toluene transporter n=1 Tax=Aristophania vespae TaxID=2697033 RepID=A0A6P1NDX0_9PROT|nr:ABC transporter substrate-binding protein [Aristophania vespae]QHI95117.1 hypothetical protein GT348_01370 [Aristophania vespae]UMM64326.1 hypothetical protein DM15PD_13380 [Aristophania vespae]